MIKNYKKPTWIQTLSGCAVLLVLCTVSMTTFAYREEAPNNELQEIRESTTSEPSKTSSNEAEISIDDSETLIAELQIELAKAKAKNAIKSEILIAELQLELAKVEAKNAIEVEYAKVVLAVALAEEDRIGKLNEQAPDTVAESQVLEKKLQRVRAEKMLQKATYDHETLKPLKVKLFVRELDALNARIAESRGLVQRPEDSVKSHQIRIAEVLLEQAKALENDTFEVEYAQATLAVALAEVDRIGKLNEQAPNTVSAQEVLEAKLRRGQARAQFEKAQYDRTVIRPLETEIRKQELTIAWARLQQDSLSANRSPHFQIVDDFLSSLAAAEYGKVLGMGDDLFRSQLTSEQLQMLAETIENDFGKFQNREEISTERTEKFTVATRESLVYTSLLIRENREKGSVVYRIHLNEANQVIGFFIVESEKNSTSTNPSAGERTRTSTR